MDTEEYKQGHIFYDVAQQWQNKPLTLGWADYGPGEPKTLGKWWEKINVCWLLLTSFKRPCNKKES